MTDTPPSDTKLPADLEAQIGALKALATTYNLLANGSYPGSKHFQIKLALDFNKSLYDQSLEKALSHPSWELSEHLQVLHKAKIAEETEKRLAGEAQAIQAVEKVTGQAVPLG